VARLGGDEFTVLLMDVGSKENVRRVANIILKRIRQPYNLGEDHQGHISASIGVSLYPGDGDSFDELLSNADKAMYHAKLSGKNCLAFFNDQDEAIQKSE
jgi:diguanylate cyclase (GGDEF)-like protein